MLVEAHDIRGSSAEVYEPVTLACPHDTPKRIPFLSTEGSGPR